VLFGVPPVEPLPVIAQESLILRIERGRGDDPGATRGFLPKAAFMDLEGYAADLFEAAPKTLATRIGSFLDAA
jgi:hypothetical protein